MRLPRGLEVRQQDEDEQNQGSSPNTIALIIAIVILSAAFILTVSFFTLRQLRLRNYEPRYLPTQTLKDLYKTWKPGNRYDRIPLDGAARQHLPSSDHGGAGDGGVGGGGSCQNETDTSYQGAGPSVAGVDRNTSVRSVMTLPSYSATPTASEQVIGREGERAGMDVVVEFPETNEEEEERREEQMESLYQIRLARRQEQEEREERRRQRREARERGDTERLEELRRERRARSRGQQQGDANGSNTNLSVLLAEHQSRGRDARVSSVSYMDVGHVRHDGTRVRDTSQDSDSRPLLDAAGSIAATDGDEHSLASRHHRGASGGSLASQSSGPGWSEHHANNNLTMTVSNSETDIGDSSVAPPPQYEQLQWRDAPAYPELEHSSHNGRRHSGHESVEMERFPDLPALAPVPSISIETATPSASAPITPVSPQADRGTR